MYRSRRSTTLVSHQPAHGAATAYPFGGPGSGGGRTGGHQAIGDCPVERPTAIHGEDSGEGPSAIRDDELVPGPDSGEIFAQAAPQFPDSNVHDLSVHMD